MPSGLNMINEHLNTLNLKDNLIELDLPNAGSPASYTTRVGDAAGDIQCKQASLDTDRRRLVHYSKSKITEFYFSSRFSLSFLVVKEKTSQEFDNLSAASRSMICLSSVADRVISEDNPREMITG